MPNIGPLEIILVLVVLLVIFGPKRLPELGRSMGRGMREFKDSVTGKDKDDDDDDKPALTRAAPQDAAGQPAPPVEHVDQAQPVHTGEPRA